ncbi:ElyC/SanA/YdcF family protein [Niabella sp. 22666]|uniref:ElyC/SanA/YdcF family protein n=1 Tax=Niabella sp. 22666 TaxID=3453954 RepID=UPI003F86B6D3
MKREIERHPEVPFFSLKIRELLSGLCFRQDKPQRSDLIFAFGTNIIPEILAGRIEELLGNKIAETVLITGGIANYINTEYKNIPESDLIYSAMDRSKFPGIKFILERRSKNNLENVLFSASKFPFSQANTITCLSHSYASRRSVQTLKRIFPGTIFSYPYDIPSEKEGINITLNNWWETERGRSLVWGEFLRIRTYGGRGDFPLTAMMRLQLSEINLMLN